MPYRRCVLSLHLCLLFCLVLAYAYIQVDAGVGGVVVFVVVAVVVVVTLGLGPQAKEIRPFGRFAKLMRLSTQVVPFVHSSNTCRLLG